MSVIKKITTYNDFLNKTIKEPRKARYTDSENISDHWTGWSGSKDFAEALNYAKFGWNAGIKEIGQEGSLQVSGGSKITKGVAGAIPDIPAFLSGVPENMFTYVDEVPHNRDQVTLFVPLTYSSGYRVSDALLFCKDIVKEANKLGAKNDLRIVGMFGCDMPYDKVIDYIIIKGFDQQLVLNNIAFSMHPAFFRRLYFRRLETYENLPAGYGTPSSAKKIFINHTKKDFNMTSKDVFYTLPSLARYCSNGKKMEKERLLF